MRKSPRSLVIALALSTSVVLAHPPRVSAQTYEVMYAFSTGGGFPQAGLVAGPTGIFYGTTTAGGDFIQGSVYSLTPDGSGGFTQQNLHSFALADGASPRAALVFGPEGNLYGTAHDGGTAGTGTIFRISTSGSFLRIHDFADGGGQHPSGLILASDGNFYGVASAGGDHDAGTVFRLDPAENVTVLHSFDPATEGTAPVGELLQSGGFLYGTTTLGGANDMGTVYRIDLAGALTTLHEFDGAGGSDPESALILATDGNFYGTTKSGGTFGQGTVFHVDAAGTFGSLHSLDGGGTDGGFPVAALFQASDGKLYGGAANGGIGGGKDSFPGGTLFRVDTAGTFGVIHPFIVGIAGNGPGSGPLGAMIDGHDGFLYGTTIGGSMVYRVNVAAQFSYAANVGDPSDGYFPAAPLTEVDGVFYGTTPGTLFRLQGSSFTNLHTFGVATGDGSQPVGGLLLASDGNLYGATRQGGSNFRGTIYRYSFPDAYGKIHDFDGTDSTGPNGDLIEPAAGEFYGTTVGNGVDQYGSVFQMDTSGAITTLHFLASDEIQVPDAGPARSSNGDLYATGTDPTFAAGIFSVDSLGAYTSRHVFDVDTEGNSPDGPLLRGTDDNLYGVASSGGPGGEGTVFRYDGSPTLTVLKAFSGDADGNFPFGGLVQAADGNFYGVTFGSFPPEPVGTIFRIDSSGDFATVHTFGLSDGGKPLARLIEGSDGALYGTASDGGYRAGGVIFRFVLGAVAPSLTGIAPASGRAAGGTPFTISGEHLSLASAVSIGGVAATTPFVTDQGTLHSVSPALEPGALYDVTVDVGAPGLAADSVTLTGAWFADFSDVDQTDIFHSYIETIFRNGITAGCGGGYYCRNASVTRAQMAVFLLKAEHGAAYVPPTCQSVFPDVACPSLFADWIEQLAAEGVTAGCGGGLYCPDEPATRRQMAVFLLKTKEGAAYAPPPATGVFGDVPADDTFAPWIEELYHRNVTGGCQAAPPLYCPDQPNTRGQMAVSSRRRSGSNDQNGPAGTIRVNAGLRPALPTAAGLPPLDGSSRRPSNSSKSRPGERAPDLSPPRLLDGGDVDLLHRHHRVERPLRLGSAGRERLGQCARRDLPREAPAVLAPAAGALLAAVADDGVPVAVGLFLIVGRDLEGKRLAVLEHRAAVQAEAGDAEDRELDGEDVALLAAREVARAPCGRR